MTVPRDASGGGRRSLGRQMLLRALNRHRQAEIARKCGCSQSQISRLAAGAETDSYSLRRALERYFGIPAGAWDEPASDAPTPLPALEPAESNPVPAAASNTKRDAA